MTQLKQILSVAAIGIMVHVSPLGFGEERYESDSLKGFSRAPEEHMIVEIDKPFTVRTVKGTVVFEGTSNPLPNVIFEIRGPGDVLRIRGTKTDKQGRFSIRGVRSGSYLFKATLNGFQSIVGTIVVSEKASRASIIKLEMLLGV